MQRTTNRRCRECGSEFQPSRADSHFCARECGITYHNRRKERGTQLYDLFMLLRYERGLAVKLGLWGVICRQAMRWRDEDNERRAGRKSWLPWSEASERLMVIDRSTK